MVHTIFTLIWSSCLFMLSLYGFRIAPTPKLLTSLWYPFAFLGVAMLGLVS
jgi:hypothetical protein